MTFRPHAASTTPKSCSFFSSLARSLSRSLESGGNDLVQTFTMGLEILVAERKKVKSLNTWGMMGKQQVLKSGKITCLTQNSKEMKFTSTSNTCSEGRTMISMRSTPSLFYGVALVAVDQLRVFFDALSYTLIFP